MHTDGPAAHDLILSQEVTTHTQREREGERVYCAHRHPFICVCGCEERAVLLMKGCTETAVCLLMEGVFPPSHVRFSGCVGECLSVCASHLTEA